VYVGLNRFQAGHSKCASPLTNAHVVRKVAVTLNLKVRHLSVSRPPITRVKLIGCFKFKKVGNRWCLVVFMFGRLGESRFSNS
jgi:hypothetical protein